MLTIYLCMEYQSIDLDLDEKIIVKIDNNYHEGNIFFDDGMIAICRFDSYLIELDCSEKKKADLSILFDLFEDELSEVYGQIVEFYQDDDYLSIAEDIMKSISNKKVNRYCSKIIKLLGNESSLELVVEQLNQLQKDSKLLPSDIPMPQDKCIYHTTRSLFFIRGRKSRINQSIRRFTIAKRVLQYLIDDKYSIRLEIVSSQLKVLFHVSEDVYDKNIKLLETKKILSNGDGSMRINLPQAIYSNFSDEIIESELFIQLKDDLIEFLLCAL